MKQAPFSTHDLYVAPDGNDAWSGTLAAPSDDGTDGPFASLAGARNEIRRRKGLVAAKQVEKHSGGLSTPTTVWIRGGRYETPEPVVFDARDSAPVTYAAYPGERPVFHGSRRITGWRAEKVNGRDAWVTDLPEVAEGSWYFRELFVDGERRSRPRYPGGRGLLRMEEVPGLPETGNWRSGGGYTRFRAKSGDIPTLSNINDVEVVYLHFWIEERSTIVSYDEESRLVTMARPSRAPLFGSSGSQLADYYLDNVYEALTEPGHFYLDRTTGRLTYLPLPGEDPQETAVYAPCTLQLLALTGDTDGGRFVEFLRFRGLTFEHTDWRHPDPSDDGASFIEPSGDHSQFESRRHYRGNNAAASQGAADVPGVIFLEAARHCAFEGCTIQNVGWYGVQIADACRGIAVRRCTIRQMGAGGVKIGGASAFDPLHRRTGDHAVTDNEIAAGGRIFHSAVGVLCTNSFNTEISHNHIHDLYYTGISCGWVWGYMESVSRDNRIEKNHIHSIGQGVLSDMGGIYTLGVQPGSTIRGNLIHDIRMAHYGGWCIYPDEGSSHLLIENNVCYDTNDTIFNQHYGRENLVRNNIFGFGDSAILSHGRADSGQVSIRFERNVFLTDGSPIFRTGYGAKLREPNHASDLNLFWDVNGNEPVFSEQRSTTRLTFAEWKALGHDAHSLFADPGFAAAREGDFTTPAGGPLAELGFAPIDTSDVGPRPEDEA